MDMDSEASSPNLSALAAISKGMRAVKLCSKQILHVLTAGSSKVDLHSG